MSRGVFWSLFRLTKHDSLLYYATTVIDSLHWQNRQHYWTSCCPSWELNNSQWQILVFNFGVAALMRNALIMNDQHYNLFISNGHQLNIRKFNTSVMFMVITTHVKWIKYWTMLYLVCSHCLMLWKMPEITEKFQFIHHWMQTNVVTPSTFIATNREDNS